MAYSSDEDLEILIRDVERLSLPLTKHHLAATAEIDRILKARGASSTDLARLDADTLQSLRTPSAHYALFLYFQGFPQDSSLLDRAKFHLSEFLRLMQSIRISTEDSDGESVAVSGSLSLG